MELGRGRSRACGGRCPTVAHNAPVRVVGRRLAMPSPHRRRSRLSRSLLLSPMAARQHRQQQRPKRRRRNVRSPHRSGSTVVRGGGGDTGVPPGRCSIRSASFPSSAAAARSATDPLRRTSGTTSSLRYAITRRRSSSTCAPASRRRFSHAGLPVSTAITTPHQPRSSRSAPKPVNVS